MKRLKFEDLLRDSISKYAALSLQLSKCNSRFSVELFLDNSKLTSKSCDFGTWYFTQKSSMDLLSLKEVETPYIKVFVLYKKLEEQYNTKISRINNIKKKIPFLKFEQDPIYEIISDLHINCLLLVNALKKVEAEYITYQALKAPMADKSTKISRKIDANIARMQNEWVSVNSRIDSFNDNIATQTSEDKKFTKVVQTNNAVISAKEEPEITIQPHSELNAKTEPNELITKNSNKNLDIKTSTNAIASKVDKTLVQKSNYTKESKEIPEILKKEHSRNIQWESLLAMKKLMDELG